MNRAVTLTFTTNESAKDTVNNKKKKITAIDLFCGAGGMSLGFEQAGIEVLGAFDWEQRNIDTYNANFPNNRAFKADLKCESAESLRKTAGIGGTKVDVVFGGPPCQGFSVGGKKDIKDERNQLVSHFGRLVEEISPDYFIMENVAGLLHAKATKIVSRFIKQMNVAGYEILTPQLLDASDFGVPQRRRRVFFLGHKRELPAPAYPIYPSRHDDKISNSEYLRPTVWDAISDLPSIEQYDELFENDTYHGELGHASPYAALLRNNSFILNTTSEDESIRHGLSGCLRTRHSPKTIKRFENTLPGQWEMVSRFYRLHMEGIAPTIRAGTGDDHGKHTAPRPIHPSLPRCITVREAARLHSFPDWFRFHPTRWHGFRQIGNSVPPFLAKAVSLEFAGIIHGHHTKTRAR